MKDFRNWSAEGSEETANVLGHVRGATDPKRTDGWVGLSGAWEGAHMLELVRRFERTDGGPLILGALRTFHDKAVPEHVALADLYVWLCSLDDVPCLPAADLAKRFLAGEEMVARHKTAEFYADCVLRLDEWLKDNAV